MSMSVLDAWQPAADCSGLAIWQPATDCDGLAIWYAVPPWRPASIVYVTIWDTTPLIVYT